MQEPFVQQSLKSYNKVFISLTLLIEGKFSDELQVKKLYCLQPQHILQLSIERKEVNIKFGKSAVTVLMFRAFNDDHLAYCGS